jgi:hypothetical protein
MQAVGFGTRHVLGPAKKNPGSLEPGLFWVRSVVRN